MSQFNHSSNYSNDIQTAMFADCLANSKEIFKLIDSVFPLDSCQHYQVLPLKLEGNDLTVGMLDPGNEESLKFVNSIANVFKYNLELQLIDTQTHQIILASYSQNSQEVTRQHGDHNKTVIDSSFKSDSIPLNEQQRNRRRLADSAPTIISQPDSEVSQIQPDISQDLPNLPNLPPDFDFLKDLDLAPSLSDKPVKLSRDGAATVYETPSELRQQKVSHNLDDKPTVIGGDPAQLLAQDASANSQEIIASEVQISDLIAETPVKSIELQEEAEIETVDFLQELMPQLSWHKLLEQSFEYKSELISLTRHSDHGSIIISKNQSTQSSIDQVPLPIFCSLIDEIKRMARIPHDTTTPPKKVVLERLYDQERILLRLEFIFQDDGEKVIIQVLRDQALKIYEQKQIDKISEQALQLAKQLEKALRKIQSCFDSAQLSNLSELQTVQSRINHQLRLLHKTTK